jgi:triacylglycerol lipase
MTRFRITGTAALLQLVLVLLLLLSLAVGWLGSLPMALGAILLALLLPAVLIGFEVIWAARSGQEQADMIGSKPLAASVWWRIWRDESLLFLRLALWRLPFGERSQADALGQAGQRGVLFVHGYLSHRGLWAEWQAALHRRGHASLSISLHPALASIDAWAVQIENAVQTLETSTGQAPLVVAHSLGGLALRAWWRWQCQQGVDPVQAAERIHSAVTVACPHQGLEGPGRWFPGSPAREARSGSTWLVELAAAETVHWRSRFLCILSDGDNIVFPVQQALLPDARILTIPACGHLQLLFDKAVRREVLQLLQESSPVCVSRFDLLDGVELDFNSTGAFVHTDVHHEPARSEEGR